MDLYATLNLTKQATAAEIKAAHRRLAKTAHPDAGGTEAAFAPILLAYTVLRDKDRRQRYDATGTYDTESIENERAQFLQLLAQHAAQALQSSDTTNFLDTMRASLEHQIKAGEQQLDSARQAIVRIDKVLNKLKRKSGDGALISILNSQKAQLNANIDQNNQILSRHKSVAQHLKDYEYNFVASQPTLYSQQQSGNWFRGFNP